VTRREFSSAVMAQAIPSRRPRIAAIVTEYRWFSHADVICGRLLGGCSPDNQWRAPRTQLVSVYTAQVPANDMSRDLAARHGFKIFPTISSALTLGGDRLAVDGVVFIGEHGNYPTNELGQKLYPRFELFSEILDVYEKNGGGVPTFFDKHLSYSWDKALSLYQRAAKLKFPWFAGSSIPLTVRQPVIDIALDTTIQEAAVVGYADLDAYGFHTLEAVQSLIERRKGGETGVARVEMMEGDRARQAAAGDLVAAALEAQRSTADDLLAVFRIDYRDGLKLTAPMLKSGHWSAALRTPQGILATRFGIDGGRPLPHFDGLVSRIEEMMVTRKAPYPVERTLLTTGILSFLFESRRQKAPVDTPQLDVKYRPPANVWWQRA
jgi:hypothetical protein